MEEGNKWGGSKRLKDAGAEELLNLMVGAAESGGYDVKSFGELGIGTTAYGGVQSTKSGKMYTIMVTETTKQ